MSSWMSPCYYGMAVRALPGNYHKMHDAVWASFDHATSTEKKPQHDRCPVGADSWCFYQKLSGRLKLRQKIMRHARRITRAANAEASASDYAAGDF